MEKKKKGKKRLKNQNFSHFSILISVTRLRTPQWGFQVNCQVCKICADSNQAYINLWSLKKISMSHSLHSDKHHSSLFILKRLGGLLFSFSLVFHHS